MAIDEVEEGECGQDVGLAVHDVAISVPAIDDAWRIFCLAPQPLVGEGVNTHNSQPVISDESV